MTRNALLWIALTLFILAIVDCVSERESNHGLPLVRAAAPRAGDLPAWRLFTACPVDRRNVPILKREERT